LSVVRTLFKLKEVVHVCSLTPVRIFV
jgi:hypothetical protein